MKALKSWLYLGIALVVWVSAFAFALGVDHALHNEGCMKQRYADYFPPYWAGCALFELRWAEDGHPIDPENL